MSTERVFYTAVVRALCFAVATGIYMALGSGRLWCVYVGFFLTMALGAECTEVINELCSFSAGFIWALLYLHGHGVLSGIFGIPDVAVSVAAEFMITFLLLFTHLRLLYYTKFNQVPAVFAAVAILFANGGADGVISCMVSGIVGILMAVGSNEVIIRIRGKKGF